MSPKIQFVNCRQCVNGALIRAPLTVDSEGIIITNDQPLPPDVEIIDLQDSIVAPGFLELQINGALGFHFAHYSDQAVYEANVARLAKYLPSTGVTGFYPTVPTVSSDVFRHVLPYLKPKEFSGAASVLGAHVEGPFLAPSKKGAHDAKIMFIPSTTSLESIYGKENLIETIKIVTLAPELEGALSHVEVLSQKYNIQVSMGHSAATYSQGLAGVKAGGTMITHTFNAMNPLHHREPGLPGTQALSLVLRSI